MRLRDWIKQKGLTHESFGSSIGKKRVTVTSWINGYSTPCPESSLLIENETGGEVMPNDHYAEWKNRRTQEARV